MRKTSKFMSGHDREQANETKCYNTEHFYPLYPEHIKQASLLSMLHCKAASALSSALFLASS